MTVKNGPGADLKLLFLVFSLAIIYTFPFWLFHS